MTSVVDPETYEQSLVALLQQGDRRAFDVLYQDHAAHVVWAAQRVTVDLDMAQDVAQEVFAELWRNPNRVDLRRGHLRTLLMAMARYRAIDHVRAESSRRRRQQLACDQSEVSPNWTTADVAETTTNSDSRTRRCNALYAAVAQLPEPQRTSVTLAYFEGHTFREVAQITRVPEGTAKSRLTAALQRLERQLPAALFDRNDGDVTVLQQAS